MPHGLRVHFQGLLGGGLDKGGHRRDLGGAEEQQSFQGFLRGHQVAHPPAGHGVGLGKALAQQHPVPEGRLQGKIRHLRVSQGAVNIVADQPAVGGLPEGGGNGGEAVPVQHHAGGVVGGVEDDGPGPGRKDFFKGPFLNLKPGFGQIQKYAPAAGGFYDAVVKGEGRGGDDHLVPGVQNAGKGNVQGLGGADGDQHLGFPGGPSPAGFKGRNGPAQALRSLVGGVVGQPVFEGLGGGFPDGFRGGQVRLPDGEHPAVGGLPGKVGKDPDAAALQSIQLVIQLHTKDSARSSKNRTPFKRMSSLKSKVSEWRGAVSPVPRKKNIPGRDF